MVGTVNFIRRVLLPFARRRHRQPVQRGIDSLGERGIDAFHARDLLRPRPAFSPPRPPKCSQQARAPARADAGDVLQPAGAAHLLAPPAVAGDGEPVRFVAHLLDQLQRRGLGAGAHVRGRRAESGSSWPGRRSSPLATPTSATPSTPRSSSTARACASWPGRRRSAARRAAPRPPPPRGGSGARAPGASRRSRRPGSMPVML